MAQKGYKIGIKHPEDQTKTYYFNVEYLYWSCLETECSRFLKNLKNESPQPIVRKTVKGIKGRLQSFIDEYNTALKDKDVFKYSSKQWKKHYKYFLNPNNWFVVDSNIVDPIVDHEYKDFNPKYREHILQEVVGKKARRIYCVGCGHIIPKEMFCINLGKDQGVCPLCVRDLDLNKKAEEAIQQMDPKYLQEWELTKALKDCEVLNEVF